MTVPMAGLVVIFGAACFGMGWYAATDYAKRAAEAKELVDEIMGRSK